MSKSGSGSNYPLMLKMLVVSPQNSNIACNHEGSSTIWLTLLTTSHCSSTQTLLFNQSGLPASIWRGPHSVQVLSLIFPWRMWPILFWSYWQQLSSISDQKHEEILLKQQVTLLLEGSGFASEPSSVRNVTDISSIIRPPLSHLPQRTLNLLGSFSLFQSLSPSKVSVSPINESQMFLF